MTKNTAFDRIAYPAIPDPLTSNDLVQSSLVFKHRGRGPVTSSRRIRLIVRNCFDAAFERMRGHSLESDAETLREATAHWLRHTGISDSSA